MHKLVKEGQQSNKSRPAAVIDVKPQGIIQLSMSLSLIGALDPQVPSDDFIFILDEKEYPALVSFLLGTLPCFIHILQLLNLPAPLESHKTFDNKIFLKSSDIGQVRVPEI